MRKARAQAGGRPFTGRHMLAIMAAFFGVVIAVNVTLAWFATHSWTGLVVQNSYVASQHFNQDLARARAQRARGWQSRLAFAEGELSVILADREGAPVVLDELTAVVGRPVSESDDIRIAMHHAGAGRHVAEAPLRTGVWLVTLLGSRAGEPFRLDARMFVDSRGRGRLQ